MKSNKSSVIIICIMFLTLGNIFFLSSKILFKDSYDDMHFSPIGTVGTFVDRKVTLLRWDYSESQNKMEAEFSIDNKSFDGYDNYTAEAIDSEGRKLKTESIIAEKDYLVVQISNISVESEIALDVFVEGYRKQYIRFYSNTFDAYEVDEIIERTKVEYKILNDERQIDELNKQIEELEEIYNDNKSTVENIKLSNKKIEDNKKMQTQEEVKESNKQILDNNQLIKKLNEAIEEQEKQLKELNKQVDSIKKTISELKNKGESSSENGDDKLTNQNEGNKSNPTDKNMDNESNPTNDNKNSDDSLNTTGNSESIDDQSNDNE